MAFQFESARPLYVGSRPLSMGNAFTAVADEAEAGFWNPAGLIQWQGVKVFASAKALGRESDVFDSKCVAYSYRDTAFFWGNKIAFRLESGDIPDYTYYSIARKLNSYLAMGLSVKFKRRHPSERYQFFGHSPGYDLGVLWKPYPGSSAGMVIQNMGDANQWISIATLGLAHRLSDRSLLSIDTAFLFEDRVTMEPYVGWEWQFLHWIAFRFGLSDDHPTAGAGLKLSAIRIDYAWIRNEKGYAHFVSGQIKL